MAHGNSFAALTRQSRKGSTPTSGGEIPMSSVAIGAVDDSSADPLDTPILRGGLKTPGAPSPFAALAREDEPEPTVPQREYRDGAFGALTDRGHGSSQERAARRDVGAVKIVTRLVQGIAFKPGVVASDRVKSAALRDQIVLVHSLAARVALAAEPEGSHKGWIKAQCGEAIADLIARRAETDHFGEPLDLDAATHAICEVFESSEIDSSLAEALEGLKSHRYVEANEDSVADDRIKVSLASATWDLFDKVTDPRLGNGSYRFTFERDPVEVVQLLSKSLLETACQVNIDITSLDMRTAHLQGSLRRLAGLIGAEYVARTRTVMNWIAEDGLSDDEYEIRLRKACADFEPVLLPELLKSARRNFFAIEKMAPQLMRDQEAQAAPPSSTAQRPEGNSNGK